VDEDAPVMADPGAAEYESAVEALCSRRWHSSHTSTWRPPAATRRRGAPGDDRHHRTRPSVRRHGRSGTVSAWRSLAGGITASSTASAQVGGASAAAPAPG